MLNITKAKILGTVLANGFAARIAAPGVIGANPLTTTALASGFRSFTPFGALLTFHVLTKT